MKRQNKRRRLITWSGVALLFIGATVALITQGLLSSVWRSATDLIWPPKLQFSITQFIIYRTNFEDFPTCEMDIVVNNSTDKSITAELKTLKLFRENIIYRFTTGQEIVKVGPKDRLVEHIRFRDKVLDLALKIPQDSATAMVELTYQYMTNSRVSLVFKDDDVIKCTYWQVPIFNTESEALALGLTSLSIDKEIYWTNKISRKTGKTVLSQTIFTDQKGLRDIDGLKMAKESFSWNLRIPILISSTFHRKYGGVYMGSLTADSAMIEPWHYASDFLATKKDYKQYTLLGTTYEQDFNNILEFVLYNFDPTKHNESFRLYAENSKFYILLICEHDHGLKGISNSLKTQGYRVGINKTQGFTGFLSNLMILTPDEKLPGLVDKLNEKLDSFNSVIRNDGLLVFFPESLDSGIIARITYDIHHAAGKSYLMPFSFECRPYKSHLIAAPFSTPILVFMNFSDETINRVLDSLRVGFSSPF